MSSPLVSPHSRKRWMSEEYKVIEENGKWLGEVYHAVHKEVSILKGKPGSKLLSEVLNGYSKHLASNNGSSLLVEGLQKLGEFQRWMEEHRALMRDEILEKIYSPLRSFVKEDIHRVKESVVRSHSEGVTTVMDLLEKNELQAVSAICEYIASFYYYFKLGFKQIECLLPLLNRFNKRVQDAKLNGADLLEAAKLGDVKTICQLHKHSVEEKNATELFKKRDTEGRTALHLAAEGGHLDVVEFILRENLIPIDLVDFHGFTALHRSCSKGHGAVVLSLISYGANLELISNDGFTIWDQAALVSPQFLSFVQRTMWRYKESLEKKMTLNANVNANGKSFPPTADLGLLAREVSKPAIASKFLEEYAKRTIITTFNNNLNEPTESLYVFTLVCCPLNTKTPNESSCQYISASNLSKMKRLLRTFLSKLQAINPNSSPAFFRALEPSPSTSPNVSPTPTPSASPRQINAVNPRMSASMPILPNISLSPPSNSIPTSPVTPVPSFAPFFLLEHFPRDQLHQLEVKTKNLIKVVRSLKQIRTPNTCEPSSPSNRSIKFLKPCELLPLKPSSPLAFGTSPPDIIFPSAPTMITTYESDSKLLNREIERKACRALLDSCGGISSCLLTLLNCCEIAVLKLIPGLIQDVARSMTLLLSFDEGKEERPSLETKNSLVSYSSTPTLNSVISSKPDICGQLATDCLRLAHWLRVASYLFWIGGSSTDLCKDKTPQSITQKFYPSSTLLCDKIQQIIHLYMSQQIRTSSSKASIRQETTAILDELYQIQSILDYVSPTAYSRQPQSLLAQMPSVELNPEQQSNLLVYAHKQVLATLRQFCERSSLSEEIDRVFGVKIMTVAGNMAKLPRLCCVKRHKSEKSRLGNKECEEEQQGSSIGKEGEAWSSYEFLQCVRSLVSSFGEVINIVNRTIDQSPKYIEEALGESLVTKPYLLVGTPPIPSSPQPSQTRQRSKTCWETPSGSNIVQKDESIARKIKAKRRLNSIIETARFHLFLKLELSAIITASQLYSFDLVPSTTKTNNDFLFAVLELEALLHVIIEEFSLFRS